MQIDDIRSLFAANNQKNHTIDQPKVSSAENSENITKSQELRSVSVQDPFYAKNQVQENQTQNLLDQTQSGKSALDMKNEMVLAESNMTDQDYDAIGQKGYSLMDMDASKFVSVADEIKVELAKGGADVSKMGGVSADAVKAISNGSMDAAAIERQLQQADLPSDDATLSDADVAVQKVQEIDDIDQGSMLYLVKNQLPPTIENIYQASFSQDKNMAQTVSSQMTEEMNQAVDSMKPQIAAIAEDAGLEMNEETLTDVKLLLANQIPVTSENLKYMNDLSESTLDTSPDAVVQSILTSVAEGKTPQQAYLMPGYSWMDQAQNTMDVIQNATDMDAAKVVVAGKDLTVSNLANAGQISTFALSDLANTITASVTDAITATTPDAATDTTRNTTTNTTTNATTDTTTDSTQQQIHAIRLLQETRLVMTVSANYSLIRQGMSIDTTELSDLVDALKEQENAFYKQQLGNEPSESLTLDEKIATYETTNTYVQGYSKLPAALLGSYGSIDGILQESLTSVSKKGQTLAAQLTQANQSYETMMTSPRTDLGDSMKKAFRNVDTILENMGLAVNDSNEKAVRILGYNSLDITVDSISAMKQTNEQVTSVFKSMTPSTVAEMIKRGNNPLDMTLNELQTTTKEIQSETKTTDTVDDYAKFLWKMEQSNSITQEQRDSYTGIYRLMNQVEQTDGAVIGQLIAQHADVNLRNMMMGIRSSKKENMDYKVDDDFGTLTSVSTDSLTITQQIEAAFQTSRTLDARDAITPEKMATFQKADDYMQMSPDELASALEQMDQQETSWDEEYKQFERVQMKQAVQSESQVYDLLSRYDVPTTPTNLNAMTQQLAQRNDVYRKLFGKTSDRKVFADAQKDGEGKTIDDVQQDLMKAFGEACKTPEDMAKAQKELADLAENAMKGVLVEEKVGSLDVRGMKVSMTQLQALGQMGEQSETYSIPILVQDRLGNMTLKIVRGKDEKQGLLDVALNTEKTGNIRGSFQCQDGQIQGVMQTDSAQTKETLEKYQSLLAEKMSEAGNMKVSIRCDWNATCDANDVYQTNSIDSSAEMSQKQDSIQTSMLYGMARSFIDFMGEMEF